MLFDEIGVELQHDSLTERVWKRIFKQPGKIRIFEQRIHVLNNFLPESQHVNRKRRCILKETDLDNRAIEVATIGCRAHVRQSQGARGLGIVKLL